MFWKTRLGSRLHSNSVLDKKKYSTVLTNVLNVPQATSAMI